MRSQLFTTCNIVSIICGLFMIFSSIGVYLVSNAIINYNIHKNVMIQEDSPAYKFWLNPPASIYRKYYLFHVENPSEIEKGETPILKERGPYTYREVWEKRHIEFLGHEALRFTPVITLFFERNMSIGDESDLITFLNVPAISMIEVASKMQSKEFVPAMVDDLLRLLNTKLFLTKTVGELISGYQDPLMALAKLFLPEVIKDDKFSLINGKNGTEWQNYSINTGYDYASEVAKIITWDGKEKLDYWNTPNANLINGTDGTFYSPFRTKDQRLYAFSPDMCRSYSLTYLKDNEIDGIKTMDFHLPRTMFYNASYNPDNEGFCDGNCLGNGVLNISQCYGGASGFISQPHFLNAEKQFTDALEGMAPDENKHDFVLHFEPTTGVPISGNIRLMISFYMFQNEKIELVKNVKPVLFPMVWFDDDLHLDRDTRNQLAQVALYVNISFYSPIVMASVGVLTLMIHFTIVAVRWLRSKKSSSPPNENTSLINPNINSEE